jgi:hypothetical protein
VPKIFVVGKYVVFFWSNENGEPIHVHVCEGHPAANATKIWLTAAGGCVVAHNKSQIPAQALEDILDVIEANYLAICRQWKEHFCVDTIRFYC